MGNVVMEATQINYRRDEKLKTVDQKLQELSQESAIDTDIAPVFKSTSTYNPGDLVYYRNKLYKCTIQHTGAWAAGDFTATDVSTALNTAVGSLNDIKADYADIAGAFSAETAYTAGDLAIYNGIIYRCTNDHTGDWDADDFSATTIGAELNEINSNILSLSGLLSKHIGIFATGETLSSSSSIKFIKFTVPSYNHLTLHGIVFSRYGAHSIMIRNGSGGDTFAADMEPLIETEGLTASISYSGNDVTINLGEPWNVATLVLVQPYFSNSLNAIENISVTFLQQS